jgi:predicted outer membrane protein
MSARRHKFVRSDVWELPRLENVARVIRFGFVFVEKAHATFFERHHETFSHCAWLAVACKSGARAVGRRKDRRQLCPRHQPDHGRFRQGSRDFRMFEIESNKLAQDKGNAPEKKFASQMVADHKTSAELQGLVSRGKVKAELPTALDSSHRSKLEAQGRERQGLQFGFFA